MDRNKSFVHNHPPQANKYVMARYRRATRQDVPSERLKAIWAASRGPKHALQMLQNEFPAVQMTAADIKNQYAQYHRAELGVETLAGVLLRDLDTGKYWYR